MPFWPGFRNQRDYPCRPTRARVVDLAVEISVSILLAAPAYGLRLAALLENLWPRRHPVSGPREGLRTTGTRGYPGCSPGPQPQVEPGSLRIPGHQG